MKAAVYCRVSSEEQLEKGTIENQVDFAVKYCELHNYNISAWYKDNGITGTIPLEERPEGAKLLDDAKNGNFELLLIYRLDRLGRSARIILNSIYELEQHGIKIKSMTEPFDTSDPNGRFLLTILAGVADLERETILERMRLGTNRAARSGKWLGGIVPYGYQVNEEGFLEISDAPLPGLEISEADVVKLIYTLIAERRWSTIKVADYLNLINVPPSYIVNKRKVKKGKRKTNTAGIWRPARIRNMVVNTVYKGIHVYGKRSTRQRELIEREVPAIVSEDLWEKAQKQLTENRSEAKRSAKREYLLRGLIRCKTCGLNYSGITFPGSQRRSKGYYMCNGKRPYQGPYQGKCPSKNIPQKWIEDIVWNACVNFIKNPGSVLKELTEPAKNDKPTDNLESEKTIVEKTLRETETEKQRILDLYRKQLITMSDVEAQLQKISTEKETLEERVIELDHQIKMYLNNKTTSNNIVELLKELREKIKEPLTFDTKRRVVKTLVKKITVETIYDSDDSKPKANVSITYSFSHIIDRTPERAVNNVGAYIIERKEQLLPFPIQDPPYNTPGDRLRNARYENCMTIVELARRTGLAVETISYLEGNKYEAKLPTLRALAQVLNVTVAYLGCFESLPEKTYAQKIKKARLYHGLNMKEFAEALGVDARTIRNWERSIFKPLPKHRESLANYLSILDEKND